MQLQQLETDKVKYNTCPTTICTTDDLIESYGKKAQKRAFCLDCIDYKTCKGSKWSICPYRRYYITEEMNSNKTNLTKKRQYYQLSEEQINQIIEKRKQGYTNKEIANSLGLARTNINSCFCRLKKKGIHIPAQRIKVNWNLYDEKIIKLRKEGLFIRQIAKEIGVSTPTLSDHYQKLKKRGVINYGR